MRIASIVVRLEDGSEIEVAKGAEVMKAIEEVCEENEMEMDEDFWEEQISQLKVHLGPAGDWWEEC